MRSIVTAVLVVALLSTGAMFGLSADSRADADVSPSDIGFEKGSVDAESQEEAEFIEGVFHYMAIWLSVVAAWSYEHPDFARLVLANAPLILVVAVSVRLLFRASLTGYVLLAERRERAREE